jgi:hypothetical protein
MHAPADADSPVTRRNLRAVTGDGAAFSLMAGIGESFIAAFALAVGISAVPVGLVSTVPMLAGAVLQHISPAAGAQRRTRGPAVRTSRKKTAAAVETGLPGSLRI